MLTASYRLLLGRLQELLPGWTLAESADGGGIYGRGPAGESLSYSRAHLLVSRGAGWEVTGTYDPGEVAAEVADALDLALSVRGDHVEEDR